MKNGLKNMAIYCWLMTVLAVHSLILWAGECRMLAFKFVLLTLRGMVGDDSSTRGNLKRDQDEVFRSTSPSSVSELVHFKL
jgi:hypothetical protein